MLDRLSLRLRVFLFFAALGVGCLGAVVLGLWAGWRHADDPALLPAFTTAAAVAGFAILGLVAWVWFLFDENVARAIDRLAGGMRARAHAEVAAGIDTNPARYLGDLAPAAEAVTLTLAETRNALAEAVARETTRLAAEKDRLAALLSDVPVGVLLCSGDHQLVFYNGQAVELLGGAALPGLDRSVFDFLHAAPIRHAYDRLCEAGDADAASDLVCATTGAARVLAGRMRLLDADEARTGYVLTLRDVTADMAAHADRAALLAETLDRVRRPAATLMTATAVRAETDDDAARAALDAAIAAEAAVLAHAVTDLAARHDTARTDWWPLAPTRASDLADAIRAAIVARGAAARAEAAPLVLRCDAFGLVALVSALAGRLAAAGQGGAGFDLSVAPDGAGAVVDLSWQGTPPAIGALDAWLAAPLEVGLADVTGRTVLDSHGTEIWPEALADGRARLRLPIRDARRAHARPAPVPRAVVYDFDLLSKARSAAVIDTRLEDLTYVVFDTETTGLLPTEGDEIVQLAAVRIVNARRVEKEVFDTLVNPRRPIPPASTEVHGITQAMVADAPGIEDAGRQFHAFASGAVLIAHNAPFDMEFLRRHEAAIGARFDHPILDTVLLSAVVFGQLEGHSLDALTHRLGITIPEEARHTAIGDTVATADAFLRMLPMLKARGIVTFGDLLAEVRKHGRLLKDLNG